MCLISSKGLSPWKLGYQLRASLELQASAQLELTFCPVSFVNACLQECIYTLISQWRDIWPWMTRIAAHFLDLLHQYRSLFGLTELRWIILPSNDHLPVDQAQVCNGIILFSTSTNPASLIISGSLSGTRRSLRPSWLSMYRALHCLNAWSMNKELASKDPGTWSYSPSVKLPLSLWTL